MEPAHVVVFSRTTDYRHASIPDGIAAFRDLGQEHGFTVEATEDPAALTAGLPGSAAVVFLSTSGEVLDSAARAALRAYVEGGGGFVGVHAAACTEYDWPWYGELLGARFTRHPEIQPGVLRVEDHGHPATAHLPSAWTLTDEWYDFGASPRGRVRVLASADESTYEGGGMGADHPLVWCRETGTGRSFYTALGHTPEAYADPAFRRHLLGGVTWAGGGAWGAPEPG
ncbi:ThuA domain-containing protein [Streptomyces sp. NPDC058691]|uniref:ThuA domain-containing protein n=1 Tax=Streptomyces sp. NPDC058691 TaxID=3346601 RepID=UPI0036489F1B